MHSNPKTNGRAARHGREIFDHLNARSGLNCNVIVYRDVYREVCVNRAGPASNFRFPRRLPGTVGERLRNRSFVPLAGFLRSALRCARETSIPLRRAPGHPPEWKPASRAAATNAVPTAKASREESDGPNKDGEPMGFESTRCEKTKEFCVAA